MDQQILISLLILLVLICAGIITIVVYSNACDKKKQKKRSLTAEDITSPLTSSRRPTEKYISPSTPSPGSVGVLQYRQKEPVHTNHLWHPEDDHAYTGIGGIDSTGLLGSTSHTGATGLSGVIYGATGIQGYPENHSKLSEPPKGSYFKTDNEALFRAKNLERKAAKCIKLAKIEEPGMPIHDIAILATQFMNLYTEEELNQEISRRRRKAGHYLKKHVDIEIPDDWDIDLD